MQDTPNRGPYIEVTRQRRPLGPIGGDDDVDDDDGTRPARDGLWALILGSAVFAAFALGTLLGATLAGSVALLLVWSSLAVYLVLQLGFTALNRARHRRHMRETAEACVAVEAARARLDAAVAAYEHAERAAAPAAAPQAPHKETLQ